jgi:hypothetical protein
MTAMADRFTVFRDQVKAHTEYREAYVRARTADPSSVAGLPDPYGAEDSFDPAEALARLRGTPMKLQADPPRDIEA